MEKSDNYYLEGIRKTNFLVDITKEKYIKRIIKIQKEIFNNKSLDYIIKHPELFNEGLEKFAKEQGSRYDKTKPLSDHTKESYIKSLVAIFNHNQELKENEHELYKKWMEICYNIKGKVEDEYDKNEPSQRQKEAFIPFEDVVKIRDKLAEGYQERLLLSMYVEIPPVRSDYFLTKIFNKMPTTVNEEENFIVLDDEEKTYFLCLQKYKTSKRYKILIIDLPEVLVNEIKESIKIIPRNHLFVSCKDHKPYNKENTFNRWANRTLQNITKKPTFTLTMLRHLYISRPDLDIQDKCGLERKEIAKKMGHSIEQQRKYLWHSWLRKLKSE